MQTFVPYFALTAGSNCPLKQVKFLNRTGVEICLSSSHLFSWSGVFARHDVSGDMDIRAHRATMLACHWSPLGASLVWDAEITGSREHAYTGNFVSTANDEMRLFLSLFFE